MGNCIHLFCVDVKSLDQFAEITLYEWLEFYHFHGDPRRPTCVNLGENRYYSQPGKTRLKNIDRIPQLQQTVRQYLEEGSEYTIKSFFTDLCRCDNIDFIQCIFSYKRYQWIGSLLDYVNSHTRCLRKDEQDAIIDFFSGVMGERGEYLSPTYDCRFKPRFEYVIDFPIKPVIEDEMHMSTFPKKQGDIFLGALKKLTRYKPVFLDSQRACDDNWNNHVWEMLNKLTEASNLDYANFSFVSFVT